MKICYKEPAKTIIISEEELTKALTAWAERAFHMAAVSANIVHDADYPNSIFVELSAEHRGAASGWGCIR